MTKSTIDLSACPTGLRGLNCTQPCNSRFCEGNTCDRYKGKCIGCVPGRYGELCNEECNMCSQGSSCQQSDGACNGECVDGQFGAYCTQQCSTCISCQKSTGRCTECPDGKFGEYCTLNCSASCMPSPSSGSVSCELDTASCDSGRCIAGYWGTDCFKICNTNCDVNRQTDTMSCNIDTGMCDGNCTSGYYDPQCSTLCISLCLDRMCDRTDGVCADCYNDSRTFNCPDAGTVMLLDFQSF